MKCLILANEYTANQPLSEGKRNDQIWIKGKGNVFSAEALHQNKNENYRRNEINENNSGENKKNAEESIGNERSRSCGEK